MGLAIGPVFVGVMAVQAELVPKCEVWNKHAPEDVGASLANVQAAYGRSAEYSCVL